MSNSGSLIDRNEPSWHGSQRFRVMIFQSGFPASALTSLLISGRFIEDKVKAHHCMNMDTCTHTQALTNTHEYCDAFPSY